MGQLTPHGKRDPSPNPAPRPVCLLSIRAAPPTTSPPSPVGGDKKATLQSYYLCACWTCAAKLISAPPTSCSPELSSWIVSDFFFPLFFVSVFCLYNVELKKLSEFYGEKGKSPVQRAVSLAQRAAGGGNAQPAARLPDGSAYLILFSVCFMFKHPQIPPLWKSIAFTGLKIKKRHFMT